MKNETDVFQVLQTLWINQKRFK